MWYLDTTKIIIQKRNSTSNQIIARLQPLAAGTILQSFGYESEMPKLSGKIVGDVDKAALTAMTKDYALHTLSGPNIYNNFYVKSFTYKQIYSTAQTIRPDLSCSSVVYDVEIELYE